MSWLPPLPPTWSAALRDVQARSAQARTAAADRLGGASAEQRPEALRALTTLADDPAVAVRAAAVAALGRLDHADAMGALTRRLEDASAVVRELAACALGQCTSPLAVDALERASASLEPAVRFQAVGYLAERDPLRASSVVARLLSDDDPAVRGSAARAAGVLAARGLPEPLLPRLRALLRDADDGVCAQAALALGQAGDRACVERVISALEDPELRIEALDAAPAVDEPRLREAVAGLAQRILAPRALKAAAARALLRMGDPRGVAALRAVLTGFFGSARSYAVEIAGEQRVLALVPELATLVADRRGVDPEVLEGALQALAGNPQAADALSRLRAARGSGRRPDAA